MILNDEQLDILTESFNIGVGGAASMLSDLIGKRIDLRAPKLEVYSRDEAIAHLQASGINQATAVLQGFDGPFAGQSMLVFPKDDGFVLARLLTDGDASSEEELNLELGGILLEVGNIVLNGVMGSISNLMNCRFDYQVPCISQQSIATTIFKDHDTSVADDASLLVANTLFSVANENITGSILVTFQLDSIKSMLSTLDAPR